MSSGGSGWDPTQSGRPDEGKEEGQEGGAPPPPEPEGDPGSGWSTTTVWKVQKQPAPFVENWTTVTTIAHKSEADTIRAYNAVIKNPYFDYRLVRADGLAVLVFTPHTKEKEPAEPSQGGAAGGGTGGVSFGEFELIIPEWVWGLVVLGIVGAIIYVVISGVPKDLGTRVDCNPCPGGP